jgi:hypothetical protein
MNILTFRTFLQFTAAARAEALSGAIRRNLAAGDLYPPWGVREAEHLLWVIIVDKGA